MPTDLEGDTDRKRWGHHIAAFYRDLYGPESKSEKELTHRLWTILRKLAQQERKHGSPIRCYPEEVREIIGGLSYGRAGGPDGLPSNVVKTFPWETCVWMADQFTQYLQKAEGGGEETR